MLLTVTYWGGVWNARIFDLLVDGNHLATQRLRVDKPGEFFDDNLSRSASLDEWKADGHCPLSIAARGHCRRRIWAADDEELTPTAWNPPKTSA